MFRSDTTLKGCLTSLAMLLLVGAVALPTAVRAQGTRFLRQPDVSASHIVFVHANDLWLVGREGGQAVRLTSFDGAETDPAFSADGRWIAFSGQYGGNTDVYVIPAAGGQPERLTWHLVADVVQGWTPDGDILFESSRNGMSPLHSKFWVVSPRGGLPGPLALPQAHLGNIVLPQEICREKHANSGRGDVRQRHPKPAQHGNGGRIPQKPGNTGRIGSHLMKASFPPCARSQTGWLARKAWRTGNQHRSGR